MRNNIIAIMGLVTVVLLCNGCQTMQRAKRTEELGYQVAVLKRKMEKLRKEKDAEIARLTREKEEVIALAEKEKMQALKIVEVVKLEEVSALERAYQELELKLKEEIEQYKARVTMTENGLVVTFLSEIFFDSGQAVVKQSGEASLMTVAKVLNEMPEAQVSIEGHTDNDPIRSSGWSSNWELSTSRALAVLHYFIKKQAVEPKRLSASGFGEYKPIQSNETVQGRQQNRRVEIVIVPPLLQKSR